MNLNESCKRGTARFCADSWKLRYPTVSKLLEAVEACPSAMRLWAGMSADSTFLENKLEQWRKDGRPEISWNELATQRDTWDNLLLHYFSWVESV